MSDKLTLVGLAEKFREQRHRFPDVESSPRAVLFAETGREQWGIWMLRPRKPQTESSWVTFSLLAAQAIEVLGIAPVPTPEPLEYDPTWRQQMEERQEVARNRGEVADYSDAVPHGLNAVDPCTRAWLHFLRRESLERGSPGFSRDEPFGLISDVFEASAVQCERSASERIRARLQDGSVDERNQSPVDRSPDTGAHMKETMRFSAFWKARQAEFEKYANQYPELLANWDSRGCVWWLIYGHNIESFACPPQQCVDVFEAVARNAVVGLPARSTYIARDSGPRAAENAEAFPVWLDFMRFRGWGFQETSGPTACTEREWDAGVKEGKPLFAVRREYGYTTGDEWKEVYRRTASGELQLLSAEDLEATSHADRREFYHWLPNGTIAQVFQTSARFCEELASQAFVAEAGLINSGTGAGPYPSIREAEKPSPIDEAYRFVAAYRKSATQSEEALALMRQTLRAPKLRVSYPDLENTIVGNWLVPPDEITVQHINRALHLLASKSDGGVELDELSCESYGIDYFRLVTLMETFLNHEGDVSLVPKVPRRAALMLQLLERAAALSRQTL